MFYGSLAAAFNNIVLIGFACSTLCYIQSAQYECERVTGHESVTLSGYYKIVSRFCSIGCFLILPETAAAIQLSLLIWHGGMFAYYYPMIVAYIFGFGLVPILVVGIGYFVCLRCNTKLVTAQPLSPSPQPPVEHLVITPPFPLSPRYVSFPPEFSDDASLMP